MESLYKVGLFVAIFATVYFGYTTYENVMFIKKFKEEEFSVAEYKGWLNNILKKRKGKLSFDYILEKLERRGNPADLSPAGYVQAKMISTIFLAFMFHNSGIMATIIAGFIGFFILDVAFYYTDRNNMKQVKLALPDVCDSLILQTTAGVPFMQALSYCFLVSDSPRLRKSLSELGASIRTGKPIEMAIDAFNAKFVSTEIDSFVIMLKQTVVTGKVAEGLQVISKSYKDMNENIIDANTKGIDRQKVLIEMLLFIGIAALILYGMSVGLKGTWNFN